MSVLLKGICRNSLDCKSPWKAPKGDEECVVPGSSGLLRVKIQDGGGVGEEGEKILLWSGPREEVSEEGVYSLGPSLHISPLTEKHSESKHVHTAIEVLAGNADCGLGGVWVGVEVRPNPFPSRYSSYPPAGRSALTQQLPRNGVPEPLLPQPPPDPVPRRYGAAEVREGVGQ